MKAEQVDMFMTVKGKFFPAEMQMQIREQLLAAPEEKWAAIDSIQFKNPMVTLALCFFLGGFAVDYFYLGKTTQAIIRLVTCGILGLWTLYALFTSMSTTRKVNYEKLVAAL